jgi:uncharacterized membrane protein (UPF0127 family)
LSRSTSRRWRRPTFRSEARTRCGTVVFGAAFALALAFVSHGAAQALPHVSTPQPTAALECANPRLPASILDGRAVQRPSAAPLRTVDLRAPNARLHLAVAAGSTNLELGLMCVTRLRPHAGMLFEFTEDDERDFWMKQTLIALDMVWLASDGRVTSIAADVPASKLETSDADVAHRSGFGRYVIELGAGDARRAKIAVGTVLPISSLRLPSPSG